MGEVRKVLAALVVVALGVVAINGAADAKAAAPSTSATAVPQATPPQSFYDDQDLVDGFQFITTRDGTKLSATVRLPGPANEGPYPTVIEYSGYDPSNPDAPQPSTQIAQLLGYATVGVNIRGTGCSGGSFDYFEPVQALDGYDVVETVAAQPWVLHGKPGMIGISYPGIAQTFVAPTRPPHLAAIAPLSVYADTYRSLAYPGGIPNIGFPREWAAERDANAQPYGQGWEQAIVDAGGVNGAQCAANQLQRGDNVSLVDAFDDHPYREPVDLADGLAPELLASQIDVPVFMGGAWQDEQTGGSTSSLFPRLTGVAASKLKLFQTNGTHVDSLVAELNRWFEFLEFYVAQRIPHVPDAIRPLAPVIFLLATGIDGVELEADRFTSYPSYAAALAAYEAEGPVRILFENGAGDPTNLGAPFGTYELRFPSWPPPSAMPTRWYFQPDQTLGRSAPAVEDGDGKASTSYVYDPTAKPATNYHGSTSDIWNAHPAFDWRVLPTGKALAFDSAPLTETQVVAGLGSVDLWLRSSAADTDLEVTVSELRPDGQEMYIQNGWLRASHRALTGDSTELEPKHPHTEAVAEPLPAGEFVSARVALLPFAHIFRPGSRLRITVEAPGGNRPFWAFNALPANGEVTNDIAHSVGRPSSVVLPVIPNPPAGIPSALPPCGSTRGQPCRPIVSKEIATNVSATVADQGVTVAWTAPVPRDEPEATGLFVYKVVAQPGGEFVLVEPDVTTVSFADLAPGTYAFTVYAGAAASTPSNSVTITTSSSSTTSTTTSTTITTTTTTVPPTTTTTLPSVSSTTAPVATTTTTGPAGTTSTTATVAGEGTAATTTTPVITGAGNGGSGSSGASGGGPLPYTGASVTFLILVGAGLALVGSTLARRRRFH
jgi:LPXTG-motif cell wall-anchored protein